MPVDERYRRQVALLVRALPSVAEEQCFALKGGTAINLGSSWGAVASRVDAL